MIVTASAPGKMVLMGDHAVVYGRPALVTAVDIRYSVTVEHTNDKQIEISTPGIQDIRRISVDDPGNYTEKETSFVEAAISQVFKANGARTGLKISTDGPEISYGLGSSSAITVAMVAALDKLLYMKLSQKDIFDLSYAAVLDVQGKGSGVDLAAAVFGGLVYYIKDKTIEPIAIDKMPLVIGYSGQKVGTTSLIEYVFDLKSRYPAYVDGIFDMMGSMAYDARDAIVKRDWKQFGDLVNIHSGLLDSLGVNVSQLSELVYAARNAGALGAKLSGAGGGDCMFAVASDDIRNQIEAALAGQGQLISLDTCVEGVIVEN
jgi:mevalonate kinase